MPQLHRFYVPDLCEQRAEIRLPEDELHHALHVVRLRVGDRIGLFDGEGAHAHGTVTAAAKRDLRIERGEVHRELEPVRHLTLAQAWPNHALAAETVIRRGTELSVDEFAFFRSDHSEKSPVKSDKWVRMAVESCKQCGRNRLPAFRAAKNLDEIIDLRPLRLIAATHTVDARPAHDAIGDAARVTLVVGPEGDFSARELDLIWAAGGHALSLGPLTLRAEVAAMAAITIVQYHMGRLGPR